MMHQRKPLTVKKKKKKKKKKRKEKTTKKNCLSSHSCHFIKNYFFTIRPDFFYFLVLGRFLTKVSRNKNKNKSQKIAIFFFLVFIYD